jgi:hypothetical protein
MEADKSELEIAIERLQDRIPSLITLLRGLKPESKPVECYYALPELRAGIALLRDLLMSAEPKELIDLIEESKLDGTKERLAVYGALLMLEMEYVAVARTWFEENTLMGP